MDENKKTEGLNLQPQALEAEEAVLGSMMIDEDVRAIKNELYPSKQNLISQMTKLFSIKNAQLFLSYSGHGTNINSNGEPDGKDEIIVPAGVTSLYLNDYIVDDEIRSLLNNVFASVFLFFGASTSAASLNLNGLILNFAKKLSSKLSRPIFW